LLSSLVLSSVALRAAEIPATGSKAPDFTLQSQEGKTVSLKEFKGQWVVLYFYPKDMTQGGTIEAHNFQRDLDQYTAKHAGSGHGPWYLALTKALNVGLSKAYFRSLGLPSLFEDC
jgi:hypothetical protein